MDAEQIEYLLTEALDERDVDDNDISGISTYEEAGILTTDNGLVLRMKDGTEFQITIVQSR